MLNIYDMEVNFNKNLYEFYNWRENDKIEVIRKIPIIKVSNKIYNEFVIKNIKVDKELLMQIKNKTEIYNDKKYMKIMHACIISNEKEALGVIFNKKGFVDKLSGFMIEDEIEILEIVSSLKKNVFNYETLGKKNNYNMFLREEIEIIDNILLYLNKYKCDEEKIKYLYYEWFNKKYNNSEDFNKLIKDVKSCFNNKHSEFLEVIKLFVA